MQLPRLFTPLLRQSVAPSGGPCGEEIRRALLADPALAGRLTVDADGIVWVTGPDGGPAPRSHKERQRWELHVRLRIAVELGADAATVTEVRWATAGDAR